MKLFSVVGKKNSGKTTLVVTLAQEFTRRGKKVGTLKHGTHPANVDVEGTDTWRHFNEGRAERVILESMGKRFLFQQVEEPSNPIELAKQYMGGMDLVIAEGFTNTPVPKLEIFREEVHREPHFHKEHSYRDQWIAMMTDTNREFPFPTFRFSDTAWLVTLCSILWDEALEIDG
ncbi:MAG: molybdopterin-guanine dinucleotide biosynthesis protein B [Gemmatimonadota bacterium]|nr:molybdopterin-guanine dinucleotide biosynthesis protein B [Gemmatimonadota bacterium]